MRIGHLWYHRAARKGGGWRAVFLGARPCDPEATVARLSDRPQPALSWFDRWIAIVTTPFKFLGISGWSDTGCSGRGRGRLVRAAQHSTDGFWTLDIAIEAFAIGEASAGPDRFLRIEVEPETAAHAVCASSAIPGDGEIAFGGPIVVDTDGSFLECHPSDDLAVLGTVAAAHHLSPRERSRPPSGRG